MPLDTLDKWAAVGHNIYALHPEDSAIIQWACTRCGSTTWDRGFLETGPCPADTVENGLERSEFDLIPERVYAPPDWPELNRKLDFIINSLEGISAYLAIGPNPFGRHVGD